MQAGLLPLCECPNCRTRADLTVFLTAAEPAEALNAMIAVNPPLKAFVKPMMLYTRLFVPEGETVGYKMMARLFGELAIIIGKGTVEKGGFTYKVTPSIWAQGFQLVRETNNLDLPLTGHSYYLGIVGNLAREHDKKGQGVNSSKPHHTHTHGNPSTAPAAVRMPTAEEKQKAIEAKAKIDRLYGRGGEKIVI